MVVGVNVLVCAFFAFEYFVGAVGDDFITVHIVRGAGTSLENISDKRVGKFSVNKFESGFFNGFGLLCWD